MIRQCTGAFVISLSLAAFAGTAVRAEGGGREKVIQLFDGKSLAGWTTLAGRPVTEGWEVVDGTIHRAARGGDIITEKEYENFDLRFEWKIARGTNSGLKYKFKRFGKQWLGCEYQILDDGKRKNRNGGSRNSTGSLYNVAGPDPKKELRPVGEFNRSRVVVRGTRIQHWLNGARILDIDTASQEWKELVARSKFRNVEGFGQNARGRIMLQDHGGEVWFRNITLRSLD